PGGNEENNKNWSVSHTTPILLLPSNATYDLTARNVESGLYLPLDEQMRFRVMDNVMIKENATSTSISNPNANANSNANVNTKPMIVEFPAIWERGYGSNNTAILIMSKSVLKNINTMYRDLGRKEREMSVRQTFWIMHCDMKLLQKGWRLDGMDYCCYPFIRIMVDLVHDQILHVAPIYLKGKATKEGKDQKTYLSSTLWVTGKESRLNKSKDKEKYIGDIVEFRYEFVKTKKKFNYKLKKKCFFLGGIVVVIPWFFFCCLSHRYLARDYCPTNTDITYCLCVSAFTSESKKSSKDTRELEFQAWNIHTS
ncbi:hypothetical protein RFI_17643, partial [Reticulomyxa filosa]